MSADVEPPHEITERPQAAFLGIKHLLIGVLCAIAICAATDLAEAVPNEHLVWRWLRVAGDHPLRTGLAAALLAFAARPGRRPTDGLR